MLLQRHTNMLQQERMYCLFDWWPMSTMSKSNLLSETKMKRTRGSAVIDVPPGVGSGLAKYVVDSVIAHIEAGDPRLRVFEVLEKHYKAGRLTSFRCNGCKLPVFSEDTNTIRCHNCLLYWCGRDYYCKLGNCGPHPSCKTCGIKTCGIDIVKCSTCEAACCSRGMQRCCTQNICIGCSDDGKCPLCREFLYL